MFRKKSTAMDEGKDLSERFLGENFFCPVSPNLQSLCTPTFSTKHSRDCPFSPTHIKAYSPVFFLPIFFGLLSIYMEEELGWLRRVYQLWDEQTIRYRYLKCSA